MSSTDFSLAPDKTTRTRVPAWAIAGGALTLLILAWGWLRSPSNVYDDAFITYRYAENLARGRGLVYNPGDWVLGTTAPLYALLLSGLTAMGGRVGPWGYWVSVAGWLVSAWAVLGQLWQDRRPAAAVLGALFLALLPLMAPALGMETGFLLALLWMTSWAWLRNRRWLAAGLSALAILTRQDAALFVGLLYVAVALRDRRLPWREALLSGALLAPWLAFAWWRYGSILPHSAQSKINQNSAMAVGGSRGFADQFLIFLGDNSLLAGLAIAVAAMTGLYVIVRRARNWWWLPAWVMMYVAIYVALKVSPFPWYFVPPLTGALVVCAIGLGDLLGDRQVRSRRLGAPLVAAGLFCAVVIVLTYGRSTLEASIRNTPGYLPEYQDVGAWLAANTGEADRVAAIEIGVIGYTSGRPVLDTMGLVGSEMNGHLIGWVETLAYAVSQYSPEYAIALQGTAWEALTSQEWFLERYDPAATFGRATIYRRRPPPALGYLLAERADFDAGFTITGLEAGASDVRPGDVLPAELQVEVTRSPGRDCLLATHLASAATFERTGARETRPFGGGYGCAAWRAGDRLRLPLSVEIPGDLPAGSYRLGVEFIDTADGRFFSLSGAPDARTVQLGWFRNGDPTPAVIPGEMQPLDIRWSNGITLRGVTTAHDAAAAQVGVEWQAEATPDRDLTFFVHLLDAGGRIVAQSDRRPFEGRFPVTVWRPGEVLRDVYTLPLREDLPAGEYALRFGFYDALGQLPLADGAGDSFTVGDAISLPEG